MHEISQYRKELDQIHQELAPLIRRRLEVTQKIWEIKKAQGLPFIDENRERSIVHQFDSEISDPTEQQVVQNLLRSLLHETKKYVEQKIR